MRLFHAIALVGVSTVCHGAKLERFNESCAYICSGVEACAMAGRQSVCIRTSSHRSATCEGLYARKRSPGAPLHYQTSGRLSGHFSPVPCKSALKIYEASHQASGSQALVTVSAENIVDTRQTAVVPIRRHSSWPLRFGILLAALCAYRLSLNSGKPPLPPPGPGR